MTGAILAIGRGAGEVAPVLFTGAAYFLPQLPTRANQQFMHLGYHIRHVHTVAGHRGDQTSAVLHRLCAAGSDLPVESDCDYHQKPNAAMDQQILKITSGAQIFSTALTRRSTM